MWNGRFQGAHKLLVSLFKERPSLCYRRLQFLGAPSSKAIAIKLSWVTFNAGESHGDNRISFLEHCVRLMIV